MLGQRLGAVAVVVVNVVPLTFGVPLYTFPDLFLEGRVPVWSMEQAHGLAIKNSADSGQNVVVSLFQSRMKPEEVDRLRRFYLTAEGPSWKYVGAPLSQSWHLLAGSSLPPDKDPCLSKWPLIACTPDGFVAVTGFLDTPMAKRFPDGIAEMPHMRILNLAGAAFEGPFPDLSNMTRLAYVDLSRSKLTGTIPQAMTKLTDMRAFRIAGNQMSGPLPDTLLASWVNLQGLDLSFCSLEGTLPRFGDWASRLVVLLIPGNKFSGQIPADLSKAPFLSIVDISDNMFVGQLPPFSGLGGLTVFRARGNKLEGSIPLSLSECTSLVTLDLSSNRLSGNLTSTLSLSKLTSLTTINLSRNKLEGAIPASLPSSLVFFDVSRNLFTSLPSLLVLTSLKRIDVSNNLIVGDISANLLSLLPKSTLPTAGLEEVNFSNNMFHANLSAPFVTVLVSSFAALRSIKGSGNTLVGSMLLDASQNDVPNLETVEFSNIPTLVGDVPITLRSLPSLKTVDFRGTGLRHPTLLKEDIMALYSIDYSSPRFVPETKEWCPSFFGLQVPFSFLIDPSFHNSTLCECTTGYRRTAATSKCHACPQVVTCPGFANQSVMIAPPGWYLTPPEDPVYAIRCLQSSLDSVTCNPLGGADYKCAPRFTGRLCSRCEPGAFVRNGQCVICDPLGKLLVSAFILALVLTVVFLFWRLGIVYQNALLVVMARSRITWLSDTAAPASSISRPAAGAGTTSAWRSISAASGRSSGGMGTNEPSTVPTVSDDLSESVDPLDYQVEDVFGVTRCTRVSALTLVGIIINYLQTLSIVLDDLPISRSLGALSSTYEILAPSIGEFGFECIGPSITFASRYLITWIFPISLLVLVWLFALPVAVIRSFDGREWRPLIHNAIGLNLFIVNFFYLPMAKTSMSKFKSDVDPGDGQKYFLEAPDIRFDALTTSHRVIPLIVHPVLGMVAIISTGLYAGLRRRIYEAKFWRWLGWFFSGYRPGFWAFPLLLLVRKLLLAVITAFTTPNEAVRFTSIIGILTATLAAVSLFQPFSFHFANRLDSLASIASIIIFSSSVILRDTNEIVGRRAIEIVTMFLHIFVLFIFAAALFTRLLLWRLNDDTSNNRVVDRDGAVAPVNPLPPMQLVSVSHIRDEDAVGGGDGCAVGGESGGGGGVRGVRGRGHGRVRGGDDGDDGLDKTDSSRAHTPSTNGPRTNNSSQSRILMPMPTLQSPFQSSSNLLPLGGEAADKRKLEVEDV